ncbi:hypothetical protein [Devosia sp. 919]|uniref:hypothetical protein n=1 Tax=Devosia sp. 919 TaxID=2726065 RepID=UPI0015573D38|nr:hypothetical protein [Devosia sp. 919]
MDGISLSVHAQMRIGQRGVKAQVVEVLLAYGRSKRRHGADVIFMDKQARLRARDELGPKNFAKLECNLNTYLVVSDEGVVITCAKRMARLR